MCPGEHTSYELTPENRTLRAKPHLPCKNSMKKNGALLLHSASQENPIYCSIHKEKTQPFWPVDW